MAFDSIIFDLDGTLWDSRVPIVESWNEVLIRRGMRRIKLKSLNACMGLTLDEIGARLFPELSAAEQKELMKELIENENKRLYASGATLYADLEGVLKELKESFLLYIVSNCQKGYIEAFLRAHKLKEYFKGFECWGNTGLSKDKSIAVLMKEYDLKNPVYVGDTVGDAKAAAKAGLPFIHASYGFGKVPKELCIGRIKNFKELLDIRVVGKNSTVMDILEWKKDSNKIPESVEAVNQLLINSLKWEDRDVLYSFQGIYAIGF